MLIKGVKSIKEIYWTLVVSHLVYIVPPPSYTTVIVLSKTLNWVCRSRHRVD